MVLDLRLTEDWLSWDNHSFFMPICSSTHRVIHTIPPIIIPIRKSSAYNQIALNNSRRNLRLVFHEKTVGAICDRCSTVGHAAHFATGVPRWDSRRKMRNHSANLRSLISVWKLDFSKKKYAAQFAIRLFKNKKSNSGLEIRLFRKKACGAFCDSTFHFCGMVSHFAPAFHNFGDRFRNLKLLSTTSRIGFTTRNCFPHPPEMVFWVKNYMH